MTSDEAHAEALRRIRACAESGDDLLDLGDLPLDRLPDELKALKHLRTLALGGHKPTRTAEGIEWEWEDARPLKSLSDGSVLSGLTALSSLGLGGGGGVSGVSGPAGQ